MNNDFRDKAVPWYLHNWTCMHVRVYHMQASVFSYVAIHGSIYDVIIWTEHYQIINYHSWELSYISLTRHQFTLWVICMTADFLKLWHLTIGFPLHGWIIIMSLVFIAHDDVIHICVNSVCLCACTQHDNACVHACFSIALISVIMALNIMASW